jgi:hypothetical protein
MVAFIQQLTKGGGSGPVTREQARKVASKPKMGRPKSFVFNYRPPTKAFQLNLKFTRADVDKTEVIATLEGIIAELRRARDN